MEKPMYIDIPFYTGYKKDSDFEYLDGSKHKYELKFDKEHLSLNIFWSITMYRLCGQFRENDPVRRYITHSPLFSSLVKDKDGGITIYIQRRSPGRYKENNWLPPPRDLFFIVIRTYLPHKEQAPIFVNGPCIKKRSK